MASPVRVLLSVATYVAGRGHRSRSATISKTVVALKGLSRSVVDGEGKHQSAWDLAVSTALNRRSHFGRHINRIFTLTLTGT